MKKFFYLVMIICLMNVSFAVAEQGGHIILDLKDYDEHQEQSGSKMEMLLEMGARYIQDVKEYNELLPDDSINKDFSEDIRSKYPNYDDESVGKWQKYVRNGVETYRLYERVKQKVIDFVMNHELPLVVDDNQYEMGEDETYIESDEPVIIHDFKKVVAYSASEKDQLAAEEKRAKDLGLPLPSEKIKKYKKAFLEKDWKTLFGIKWEDFLGDVIQSTKGVSDKENKVIDVAILSKFNGIDKNGEVYGVLKIVPKDIGMILLGDYKEFKGLNVDLSQSENLTDVSIGFMWPQKIVSEEEKNILGYASETFVYFQAKAKDVNKDVVLRGKVFANLCLGEQCKSETVKVELKLEVKEEIKETAFATHISIVSQNIPRESNARLYKFDSLIWEEAKDDNPGVMTLRADVDDAIYFRIIMLGKDADDFKYPKVGIDGDNVTVRFEAIDKAYSAKGKEYTFWLSTGSTEQYVHKMSVDDFSGITLGSIKLSWGIIGLAFIGGLLLNLMPCVFPVLSLKLLSLSKFGGQNEAKIRQNFFYNVLGIICSFLIIAAALSILKYTGQAVGWGMQFQNVYFLVAVIWIVTFFLSHVCGVITFGTPQFANKILDKYKTKKLLFEFFSGMFLVLLSTPCMAPYLGTAMGVALAGSIGDIWVIILTVCVGLALPYILITIWPSIALSVPKPGKWMDSINLLMVLMLIVTLGWLLSVLSAQTSSSELWHWAIYILVAFVLLFFRKTINIEIDKLDNRDVVYILRRRSNIVFSIIFFILIAISTFDSAYSYNKRNKVVEETKYSAINLDEINQHVRLGRKVLVKVGADWCLTCKYNDIFAFDIEHIKDAFENNNVMIYDVDWTHYSSDVLKFMHKYGRSGLPFYVLFSNTFPDGIVLSEMPKTNELSSLVEM